MWIAHKSRTVGFSRADVLAFKAQWPCSGLADHQYWFQFEANGDLVDTNVGESSDGSAAVALSHDAQAALQAGTIPAYAILTASREAR
jgi:hypothetical protein